MSKIMTKIKISVQIINCKDLEILKTIIGGHGEIIKCKEIRLFDNEFPIGGVFKINSIAIVIK